MREQNMQNNQTTIYLVRHCQATGNEKGTVQGITDNPITEKGIFQLECLSKEMTSHKIDEIYSSPLKRAIITAEYINKGFGKKVIIDPNVTEIDFGDMEDKPWEDIPTLFPKAYSDWVSKMFQMNPPNGEKMINVYERMKNAILKIAKDNKGKTVAIATHGCAVRNYLSYALFGTIKRIYDVPWQENTAISRIDYDENFIPNVIYAGKCDHLPDDQKTIFNQNWQKQQKL